jgi:small subunit ribosomal protein S16
MVRIRFRRVGGKGQPSYRLVAADKESPRDGRFIEILGFYNPRTEPATIQLEEDRIYDWISKGAQPSESAEKVLRTAGALDRYERFKQGEDIEVLLAESKAAETARNINPKTTHITTDVSEKGVPEKDVPEKDVPEKDVPEKDVPEKDVPEKDVTEKDVTEKKEEKVDAVQVEE